MPINLHYALRALKRQGKGKMIPQQAECLVCRVSVPWEEGYYGTIPPATSGAMLDKEGWTICCACVNSWIDMQLSDAEDQIKAGVLTHAPDYQPNKPPAVPRLEVAESLDELFSPPGGRR